MRERCLYLSDILEGISRIEFYTLEGREVFLNTQIIQDAVICNLEVISKAVKHLINKAEGVYFDDALRNIERIGSVLIHDYICVDLDEVWEVIKQDLPTLKAQITAIAQNLQGDI
ncbi:HepT-like ribonuclease domain-containing protein [Phormidesmis sp. 146-33]